ncbi:tail protein [Haematobacter missouriensis]|uniref:Phage tail protein n=1 Tax=Haematobacter missouriensis TaxID=366616 RepID=A0A212AYH4_9RHOB|nr:phage tail tape measure protein [Haematobacter missouriensis]KFI33121.1 tail protein [Haematobacter missouriensis]OWJ79775.1 phage tail protein [Haematobacter missouriensis]OWJ86525.1 phage tail protein [Haematobacter missouriensis]
MTAIDALADEIAALEVSLGGARTMAAAFDGELQGMRTSLAGTARESARLSDGMGRGVRRAFDGIALNGEKLSDALEGLGRSMVGTVYNMAMQPVQRAAGDMLSGGMEAALAAFLPFATGGGFAGGRVMPFARGGVVSAPTTFPMRGGATGLMGEAGPEAILPLARGADGSLGVRAGGGQAVNVTVNVTTPDVDGFRRSRSQIAAEMGRALSRGQRNR